MTNRETASSSTCIAWHGWEMRVPAVWRPLRVEGERRRGVVMIGDADQAIVQVKWLRPGERRFDPREWLRERLRRVAPRFSPDPDAPVPPGFDAAMWLMERPGKDGIQRSLWYGYSAGDDLVVEFVVNDAVEAHLRKKLWRDVLPSVRVRKADAPTKWVLFDIGFETPAGFDLAQRRLASGDIALLFTAGRRESLLLRQVYPAEVALARRPLEQWLGRFPFKEHRFFRHAGFENWRAPEPWRGEGICRRGWRRLPFPLGRCAARAAFTAGVLDKGTNRLLIAEHASARDQGGEVVSKAIARMNWHRAGPQ